MYFSYNAPLASNTSEAGWSDVLDRMFRNGHLALDVETLDFNTSWRVYDDIYDINPPERPHDWPWRNGSYDFPERHIFVGIQSLVHHYALTKCKVSLSYVDVNVTFEQTSKGNTAYVVNRIRQQSSPPTSIKLHAFQHPTIAWQVKESFLDTLVPWDDNRSWPPFVMQYILDPAHFKSYNYPYRNDNFSGFMAENLTISMFEQRFGLVFNTFWRAFAQTSAVTDLDREEDPSYDDPEFQRAQMHVQYLSPRPLTYKLGLPWIVLYFIASFVMLVAAITTLVLKFTHKGPDLLGYVGSLFRASSYYDITAVSTAIGGFKATRQLAGIEIRVGDVEGRNEVGRIGLAGKEKADLLYRKNRVYQ
jgi:hypothetical protein